MSCLLERYLNKIDFIIYTYTKILYKKQNVVREKTNNSI